MNELANAQEIRLGALRRFATTTTILSILGHLVLGFEQSYATPLIALATAYSTFFLFEWARARQLDVEPEYAGDFVDVVNFLLPAHIIGLTCAMFIFPGARLMPIVFATALAVASRAVFRVKVGDSTRHFLNPSNFAILVTLVAFDSVSIFLPYQFHSNLSTPFDIALPVILFGAGTMINARFTKRLPLIAAWLVAFIGQAAFRAVVFDANFIAMIGMATGAAAMLYTFFMITDPGTTPDSTKGQLLFGGGIGVIYGFLTASHQVFGLFWALCIVCAIRGAAMYVMGKRQGQGSQVSHHEHHDEAPLRAAG